ncbi:tRNA(Met) cytidine acetate ligase [Acetanaerobacterium elongatum]|nr:nucleotidyltransferase family protein [Acetanaerobacterium elongatum]
MTIAGIIAEYNPFHNGHAYQIAKTRALGATHVAVCMSGDFTQRGECAVIEKHARVKAALLGGADLIVELPLPYAVSSAERFAFGGVSVLNALGCVDILSFGSESGDISALKRVVEALENSQFAPLLQKQLDKGLVFPKARQLALTELLGEDALVLSHPNNTLGVEYIKWLERLNSRIQPVTVPRKGVSHGSPQASGAYASASLIRRHMLSGKEDWRCFAPAQAEEIYRAEILNKKAPCTLEYMERAILAKLRSIASEAFTAFPDVTEGLEGRIYKAARTAVSLDELYGLIKTKRYTLSRVRRMVLCTFLGIEASMQLQPPPYIRVLGFNARGAEILAKAKQTCSLPVSTSLSDLARVNEPCKKLAMAEAAAVDIFALCSPQNLPCGLDFTIKPVIIK